MINTHKIPFLLIALSFLFSCNGEPKIDRYIVRYSDPYFAINLSSNTPVYLDAGEKSDKIYDLEKYRIVRVLATVSLKKPKPIWYHIQESNVNGYSLGHNFKIFESQKEAEDFLTQKHPKKGVHPLLPVYHLAEQDYLKGDYKNSTVKLFRFLNMNSKLKKEYPEIYYSTMILIAKLFLRGQEYQKALVHLEEIKELSPIEEEFRLLGTQFNPREIHFYKKEIDKYFNNQPFQQRKAKLKWEILCYKALANAEKKLAHKAKALYLSLLKKEELTLSQEKNKILYINFALDYSLHLYNGMEKIEYLESLKNKLDLNNNGRYCLLKLANTIEELNQKNSLPKDETVKYLNKAKKYYRQYINMFDRRFYKDPYPREITHYLSAKERLQKLMSQ